MNLGLRIAEHARVCRHVVYILEHVEMITSPIYGIHSFTWSLQRGPVNGIIAGKHRDWKLGSLVPFLIVL